MSYILSIESATHMASVVLSKDGQVLRMMENSHDKSHAEWLSVFVEQLLLSEGISTRQLSAVAVSEGPGSYTGLRIGVSLAKGLCYGLDIPLIAIPTLKAMAFGAAEAHPGFDWYVPMIDARRMEVYAAGYNAQLEVLLPVSAHIIDPSSFAEVLENKQVLFFGTGALKCRDFLTHKHAHFIDEQFVSAQHMAQLVHQNYQERQFVDTAYFEPFYLKEFVALKSAKSYF